MRFTHYPRFSLRTLFLGVTIICVYLGLWSMTSIWGTTDVVNSCRLASGESEHVDFDPFDGSATRPEPKGAWHYVRASSPGPFLVRVDASFRPGQGSCGMSERVYFLWFFGGKVPLSFV